MDAFIFPILLVAIVAMLFFQMRKQKRSMQNQQKLQNSLTVGDRVMTTSGLLGTVVGTTEDNVDLEIAPGVHTTWLRQAVREKVETEQDADDGSDADTEHADIEHADAEHADAEHDSSETEANVEQAEKQKTN